MLWNPIPPLTISIGTGTQPQDQHGGGDHVRRVCLGVACSVPMSWTRSNANWKRWNRIEAISDDLRAIVMRRQT